MQVLTSSQYLSKSENSAKAREILEKKIAAGRQSAMALFERVNSKAPRDVVAKGRAMTFGQQGGEASPYRGTVLNVGDQQLTVHKNALNQLAQRAGIPSTYLAELVGAEETWKRTLGAEILNNHYGRGTADTRYFVRSVDGEARGFLSDRYRRLDSRPLVEAFAMECEKVGAVPVDGTFSDTRVALKAIIPQIYEPIPGEVIALGVEWGNSDFGNGLHALRAFILRVWCLNGATMENALAQVHLGRQLGDDLELSQRTYELDTKTSISALRDVVGGILSPRKIETLCDGIRSASEKQIDWKSVKGTLAKKLLKNELKAAEDAFESNDVYNLPAGKSVWRASNAISWIAGQKDVDNDRRLELERIAGEMVNSRADAKVAA